MNENSILPDSYSYYFSKDKKQCIIVAVGMVDYKQSIQMMNDVVDHPDFSPEMSILVDMQLIGYHPTYQEFNDLSNHLKTLKAKLSNKLALVCKHKMYILAQLICVFMNKEKIKMKPFTHREEAEKWLASQNENYK